MKKEYIILLGFMALGHLLLSFGLPGVQEQLVKDFGSNGISLQKFTELITIIITCGLYKNSRGRRVIKESLVWAYGLSVVLSLALMGITLYRYIPIIYFIGHLFSTIVLYTYIGRSVTGLRSWYFNKARDREEYDNDRNLITGISGGIGFFCMSIWTLPLKTSIVLLTVGGILVSIGWIVIFVSNRKRYLTSDEF